MADLKALFAKAKGDQLARLPEDIRRRVKVAPNGCWIWQGKKAGSGQAMLYVGENKSVIAYRRVFLLLNGHLPAILRHTCDDKACVNPGHLMAGTIRDNNADASRRGLVKRKLTDREVREIMHLIDRGDRMVDIAPHYGVTPELVGQIKSRKRYAWMPWSPKKP